MTQHGCCESTMGPLEEHQVLLTADPTLQPYKLKCFLKKSNLKPPTPVNFYFAAGCGSSHL